MSHRNGIEAKVVTSVRIEPTIKDLLRETHGGIQSFLDYAIEKELKKLTTREIKAFGLKEWFE